MNWRAFAQQGSPGAWHDVFACGDVVTITGAFSGVRLRSTQQHRRYCTAVLRTEHGLVPACVPPMSYDTVIGDLGVPGLVNVLGRVDLRLDGGLFWVQAVTR